MEAHVIELRGSDTATFREYAYRAKGGAHDPVPPLVRRLINERIVGRNDMVVVKRGATVCFKPRRARAWAKFDVVDDDWNGLVRRRAYIGSANPGATELRRRLEGLTRDVPGAVWPEASTTGD